MTINKKDGRKITVNAEPYIWAISPDSGYIVMVAEHESVKGRRLEVYIQSDIDSFWVNVPHTEHLNQKIVRPKDAAHFINQAIERGWNPQEKDAPAVFVLDGDILKSRI
ncbi:hypothetical protein [Paenibacillus typhae]|uniref:hypothetical protein n=1 Tax=Paenibacillus typhae TaxID=1174501 RepID=UPI001C8DCABD|nr:hypothetical protein [Paenibacillus typhae]MBY0013939.1 hypothetical protein [Paenibacillus typhae]